VDRGTTELTDHEQDVGMTKFILADPTEERHLHPSILELVREYVTGLEDMTGADLIITPLSLPTKSDAMLKRHAREGLCVQRKDINDFITSFFQTDNRLPNQLLRMCQVTEIPWLLIVGDLKCDKEGMSVADGRTREIRYDSVIAAMDSWQLRGSDRCSGRLSWILSDRQMASWCMDWYNRLVKVQERKAMGYDGWGDYPVFRPAPQTLYKIPDVQRTLMTFPGLGFERAQLVYDEARKKSENPTLMDCLVIISDHSVVGVGKKTRKSILEFVGWNDMQEEKE